MLIEDETQLAAPDVAVSTGSDARSDFRSSLPPFSAFVHLEGDRAIVMLHGELDVGGIALLIDSILIDCFVGIAFVVEVVLDFAELDFIDGAGLHVIAAISQQVTAVGGSVSIRSPGTQVRRLLELVDFNQIVAIEP